MTRDLGGAPLARRHVAGKRRSPSPLGGVRASTILGLALAWAIVGQGCERAEADRPHVILIVIDTLRASQLGVYGYERATSPFLDSFATRALRFERAIATSSWTSPSMASIFSSLYPPAHGVSRGHLATAKTALVLDDEIVTLAELLRGSGYRTLGVVANPWIAADLGYAQGFDEFHALPKPKKPARGYANAERVNQMVYETLRSWEDDIGGESSRGSEPFFLYVHYMDPHRPYQAPNSFHLWGSGDPLEDGVELSAEAKRRRAIGRYDAEIRYLDSQLEELFAFLDEQGLADNSLVIITSDHGEQLYEYGENNHGYTLHNPEIHVPLLIKIPSVSAGVDPAIVSTIDIFPTLLDALGIEIPHSVQGISLLGPRRDGEVASGVESGVRTGVRTGVYSDSTYYGPELKAFTRGDGKKLIVHYDEPSDLSQHPGEPRRYEVFDSLADYQEKLPLGQADLTQALRGSFDAIYQESLALRTGNPPRHVELDDEARRALEELGYID